MSDDQPAEVREKKSIDNMLALTKYVQNETAIDMPNTTVSFRAARRAYKVDSGA